MGYLSSFSFPNQVGIITTTNVGVGDTRAFTTLAVGSKGLVDGDAFYGVEVRQAEPLFVPWTDQVIDSFNLSDLPDWRAIEYTIYFEASIGAFQTEKIIVLRNTNTNELTSSEYGILYNEFLIVDSIVASYNSSTSQVELIANTLFTLQGAVTYKLTREILY